MHRLSFKHVSACRRPSLLGFTLLLWISLALVGTQVRAAPSTTVYLPLILGPTNTTITFVCGEEICLINSDGSNQQQLTHNTLPDYAPVWSPDKTMLAFTSILTDSTHAIFRIHADGTHLTKLAPGSVPAWSPDGQKILFSSGTALFVINADGSQLIPLSHTSVGADILPAWSPNSQQIVFTRNMPTGMALYVINADGSGETMLAATAIGQALYDATWSPDGSKIAYCSQGSIGVMYADGSHTMVLAQRDDFWYGKPQWSPDGRTILYTAFTEILPPFLEATAVLIMHADGSQQTMLVNDRAYTTRWSPDGQRIVYANQEIDASGQIRGYVISIINADGTGKQRLVVGTEPDW